jgi:hypothetical protein
VLSIRWPEDTGQMQWRGDVHLPNRGRRTSLLCEILQNRRCRCECVCDNRVGEERRGTEDKGKLDKKGRVKATEHQQQQQEHIVDGAARFGTSSDEKRGEGVFFFSYCWLLLGEGEPAESSGGGEADFEGRVNHKSKTRIHTYICIN